MQCCVCAHAHACGTFHTIQVLHDDSRQKCLGAILMLIIFDGIIYIWILD